MPAMNLRPKHRVGVSPSSQNYYLISSLAYIPSESAALAGFYPRDEDLSLKTPAWAT